MYRAVVPEVIRTKFGLLPEVVGDYVYGITVVTSLVLVIYNFNTCHFQI
jgi:hypothetical protein